MDFHFTDLARLLAAATEMAPQGKKLLLVKDHGVYLMVEGCGKSAVYAEGHHPDRDDWWVEMDDLVAVAVDCRFIAEKYEFLMACQDQLVIEATVDESEEVTLRFVVEGVGELGLA